MALVGGGQDCYSNSTPCGAQDPPHRMIWPQVTREALGTGKTVEAGRPVPMWDSPTMCCVFGKLLFWSLCFLN